MTSDYALREISTVTGLDRTIAEAHKNLIHTLSEDLFMGGSYCEDEGPDTNPYKVWEFVAVLKKEKNDAWEAELIMGPKVFLASSRESALIQAARMIPKDYDDDMDDIEIVLRLFA